jgi:hypothetical protein
MAPAHYTRLRDLAPKRSVMQPLPFPYNITSFMLGDTCKQVKLDALMPLGLTARARLRPWIGGHSP